MGQIDNIIACAQSYIGIPEGGARHMEILSIYNNHKPLARNYRVTLNDAWCMTFVSACFIKCDAVNALGRTECGCEEYFQYAKTYNMTVKEPARGDIVLYDWGADGHADHVGIITNVTEGDITVIEGNKNDTVGYRYIFKGSGQIRGIVRPKYKDTSDKYNPDRVSYADDFNRSIAGKYRVNVSDYLVLRYNPFVSDQNVITHMDPGEYVQNYGYYTDDWYLVVYKNYTGFCNSRYLRKE